MNNAPVCPSKWSLWDTFLADILPKTLNKSSHVFSLLFNCSLCIQIRSWIVYWSRKSVWEQEFMRARIAPNSYLSDSSEYKYVVIWKCRRYRFLGPASCQSYWVAATAPALYPTCPPPASCSECHASAQSGDGCVRITMGANQTVFSAEDIYFLEKHSIMDRAQVEVGRGGWTIDGATTHVSWPWADRPPLKDEKLHLTGVVHQLQLQQFGDNLGKTFRQFCNFEATLG